MSVIEQRLIYLHAQELASALADEVIDSLKRQTPCLLPGRIALPNLWEELCFQIQTDDESLDWDSLLDRLYTLVESELSSLSDTDLACLWLTTDQGHRWHSKTLNSQTDQEIEQDFLSPLRVPFNTRTIADWVTEEFVVSVADNYDCPQTAGLFSDLPTCSQCV